MRSWLRGKFKEVVWEIDLPRPIASPSVHLDLGSGSQPRNPFNCQRLIALDVFDAIEEPHSFEYVQADLTKHLPFEDNSISSISAYDVLEHIPRWERVNDEIQFPFINLMSEVWRILKPLGYFYAVTPMFPSPAAFGDPTHVNVISETTINYFVGENPLARQLGYGFNGSFEVLFSGWLRGAGPYDKKGSLIHQMENATNFAERLIPAAKLTRRFLLRVITKDKQHALWVLRKAPAEWIRG